MGCEPRPTTTFLTGAPRISTIERETLLKLLKTEEMNRGSGGGGGEWDGAKTSRPNEFHNWRGVKPKVMGFTFGAVIRAGRIERVPLDDRVTSYFLSLIG